MTKPQRAYRTTEVPVRGGSLRVGIWGPDDAPPLVAIHGITANHLAWQLVADQLTDLRIIAPDLRGRGRSCTLPGPWGMAQHADDLAQVVAHLGLGSTPVVGHSMGGFAALALAEHSPDLVRSLLLLDGGLPFVVGVEADPDALVEATLGPALARLTMTFDDATAYHDFWRGHPALGDSWGPELEAYTDYDLVGTAPHLHSAVSGDAVRADSHDQFVRVVDDSVLRRLDRSMTMITVPAGLLGQPPGLYPDDVMAHWESVLPQLRVERWSDFNHYTMIMSARGAAAVAVAVGSVIS